MRSLRAPQIVVPVSIAGTLATLVLVSILLRDRVGTSLGELGDANPEWLCVGALSFATMHAAAGLAWRIALTSGGARLGGVDAVARYAVGSGLNAVTPLRLGSAARVALFATRVGGRGAIWQVGGAVTAAAVVRGAWFATLVGLAASTGVIPWWPVVAFGSMAVASLGAAIALRRVAVDGRLGRAFAVFRELGRQPAALTSLAIATGTALATKVAAAAAIAAAVGVDRPLLAGLLVVPAVELAAALPLTPGNVGVASAAITFALGASGVPGATALAVGIAYGALEPLVAIAVGAVGGLVLFGGRLVPSLRVAAATAGALGFVGLLGAVVILPL